MNIVVDGMPQAERYDRRIKYYQWVPFFLLFSAFCYRLPSLIWRSLSDYSGIKIKELINMALDNNNVKPEVKKANLYLMNKFLSTDKYPLYGWGAVIDLLDGHTWDRTSLFPRITLCDLQIRVMGNIQEHTNPVRPVDKLTERESIRIYLVLVRVSFTLDTWIICLLATDNLLSLFEQTFYLASPGNERFAI
ncbi:Innexin [Aphelenchoides bicaudatus]|nr:Innexin [Aphelenchoides bicaudatus]